jgi:50S ribosomal protein L16 3-hydroxylase
MNGEKVTLHKSFAAVIPLLCNEQTLNYKQLSPWLNNAQFIQQITQWLKKGYWYFNAD